jgi:hypothetical protein
MNKHIDRCQCLDCKDPLAARNQCTEQYYHGEIVDVFYRFETSSIPVEKVYINRLGQVVLRKSYVPTLFDSHPVVR